MLHSYTIPCDMISDFDSISAEPEVARLTAKIREFNARTDDISQLLRDTLIDEIARLVDGYLDLQTLDETFAIRLATSHTTELSVGALDDVKTHILRITIYHPLWSTTKSKIVLPITRKTFMIEICHIRVNISPEQLVFYTVWEVNIDRLWDWLIIHTSMIVHPFVEPLVEYAASPISNYDDYRLDSRIRSISPRVTFVGACESLHGDLRKLVGWKKRL